METNTYSFSEENANRLLKACFWALEAGNEQAFLENYVNYVWWKDFAKQWIKGQI